MKDYHDRKSLREKIARPLYKLPVLKPIQLERFLALKLIPFIEGENPHWKHLGSKCPCMTENNHD
ncbi:MAG TPA: hypothetical protein VJJ25_04835 [Nitrosopumilaceae archaeon]|nr:hypothetical protein [Nitrosopumilaceae archaeon]